MGSGFLRLWVRTRSWCWVAAALSSGVRTRNCFCSIKNTHSYAGKVCWSRRLSPKQNRRRKLLRQKSRNRKRSDYRSNNLADKIPELGEIAQQKVLVFSLQLVVTLLALGKRLPLFLN